MPDIDPIVIPLKVDSSQALTPIEEVEAKVNSQSTELSELKGGFEAPSTSFSKGLTEQLEVTESSLRRIVALRKKIDNAGSETERRQATRLFSTEYDRAGKIVEDLRASISGSNALFTSLGTELSEQFRIGIQSFMPKLMSEFRSTAVKLANSTGTTDDKSLVNVFKASEAYQSIFGQLQRHNNQAFNDANMTQMLRAMLPIAVPQYTRSRYVDWTQAKPSIASVRDLLPNSFANVSLQKTPKAKHYEGNGRALTSDELVSLQRIIKSNPYAAEEFERAGLMRRHNGLAYFNPYATTENVNALGGQIARMFEIGMRGAHSNGITNIEDPKHLDKLKYRDNLYVNSARKLATELSDTFQWMTPEHIDNVPATKYSPRNWKTLGEFRAKPRQATMEFIEFDATQLGVDGKISTPGNDPSTPHKYLRVNNSLMQSWLSKQRNATPFQHNGFNNNEIYMRLPVDELQDPQLPEERKQAIRNEMIRAVRTSPVLEDGTRYTFSGLTSNHAVFTRSDLKEAIEAQDPTFFRNGEVRTSFDNFEHFGKALDASKKTRTEGEDIRKLYGTDLTGVKVVVGDLKKQTGLDGQNIISDALVPESFQGRGMGAKATYQKVNFARLFEMYSQLVNDRGDQVLPGVGIDGGDLVIPKDVGLIEDMSNIKTKHQYAGLTQDQVNQLRSQEIAEKGIFAKTTAAGHNTDTRYISAQAAATMQFGPEAKQYFHNVFLRELASLEDVGAVKSLLFSGDDYLSRLVQEDDGYLNSSEARTRIDEYRASLFARAGKGDILLPQGTANYSMLSAWLPDVLNKLVPPELLTDEQRAQSLKDNVAYFMSASDELGVFRNPATASGNLKQANKAADDYFQKTAQLLGVDPQAQYVDPQSVILKLMQGADLDGDTVFTTALKHNGEFGQIMSKVLIDTATSYKQLRESANRTDEQQERFNEQHRKDVGTGGKTYRIDPNDRHATEAERQQAAEDIVDHYIGSQAASAKMGAANAVSTNARQYRMTRGVARAILDAEEHYNTDSNGLAKYNKVWETTADEMEILKKGSPFSNLFGWALKSRTADPNSVNPSDVIFDQEAFNKRSVDRVNFTSINQANALNAQYQRYMARSMGHDISDGFNWDDIFANLPQVSNNTHAGKLTNRLRDLRLGQIKGEFLAFDDSLVEEQRVLSSNAQGEIAKEVMSDDSLKTDRERLNEFNRRFREAGGYVVSNQIENGLTKKNILQNPELAADIAAFEDITGTSAYAQGDNVSMANLPDIQTLMKVQAQNARTKLAQLERERAEKQRELEESQNRAPLTPDQQIEQNQRLANRDQLASDIAQEVIQTGDVNTSQRERLNTQQELEQQNNTRLRELDPKPFVQREVESLDEQIARQKTEVEKADAAARTAFDYFKSQSEYQRIISDAQEFSSQLYRSVGSKDAKINGTSRARLFYDQQHGIANAHLRQLENLALSGDLDFEQRQEVSKLANRINTNVDKEFASKAVLNASGLLEDLNTHADKALGLHDPQLHELETFQDKIDEANEYKRIQLEMAKDPSGKYTEDERKGFISQAASVRGYVNQSRKKFNEYEALLQADYEEGYSERMHQIRAAATGQDRSPEEQSRIATNKLQKHIDAERKNTEKAYRKGWLTDEQYDTRLAELNQIDTEEYRSRILEENQAQEDLRLARARRQDRRLHAQAEKALNGKPSSRGTYFERAEAERTQRVDQIDVLIEGYNTAIAKRKQELAKFAKGSDAYTKTQTELSSLTAERDALQAKQTALESPGAIVDDLQAFSKVLSSFNGQSPVQSLTNDFEAVEASIDAARLKYQEFVEEMDAKRARGEALTDDEQNRLTRGAYLLDEIDRNASPIVSARRELATLQEQQYLNALLHPEQNGSTDPSLSAKLATAQYREKVASTVAQLQENDNGVYTKYKGLSDEQRYDYIDSLQSIDYNQYEQSYYDRMARQQQYDSQCRKSRIANLEEQGGRLRRDSIWGNRNDFGARVVRQWESRKDQYTARVNTQQDELASEEKRLATLQGGSDEYKDAESNILSLRGQLSSTQKEASSFASGLGVAGVAAVELGKAVGNQALQFGRQLFQNAIQEAKRFVKEFDAAMTEIQMVTMKTDAQMGAQGENFFQIALDMHASVSDVTSAATNLYRQGLSDADVSVRMEDVLKFAKVAGITTSEASKIITTALSNDLVETSTEAMDALVALGDAAATSAEEIAKGMQKSAASAKQAGVSYEQLVTMLTIITSKTQLGGTQAGTALQTLMYRLYRVNQGDDYYDENGNRIGANDATRALSELGVSVYDENGNARGAYDIMVDIARNWNGASTVTQEMVLNALGAGRQRSNIATLIQGLAEDDGALAEKYMDLASNSEGITDQKHLDYMDSLEASLNNVVTAFDALVATLTNTGALTGFLDIITGLINGLTDFANNAPGWVKAISSIIGIAATLAIVVGSIMTAVPGLAPVGAMLVGIGATVAIANPQQASVFSSSDPPKEHVVTVDEVASNTKSANEWYSKYDTIIEESLALVTKEYRTESETAQLQDNLNMLSDEFGIAAYDLSDASTSIRDVTSSIIRAKNQLDAEFKDRMTQNYKDALSVIDTSLVVDYVSTGYVAETVDDLFDLDWDNATKSFDFSGSRKDKYDAEQYFGQIVNGDGSGTGKYPAETLKNFLVPTKQNDSTPTYIPEGAKYDEDEYDAYKQSRVFDTVLRNAMDAGAFDSSKEESGAYKLKADGIGNQPATKINIGSSDSTNPGIGYDKLLGLLTAQSYDELKSMSDNPDYWTELGVNEENFKRVQSGVMLAVWEDLSTWLTADSTNFNPSSFGADKIDNVQTEQLQPVFTAALGSEADAKQIIRQMESNQINDANINDMPDNASVTQAVKDEAAKVWKLITGNWENPGAVVEQYVDAENRPIWRVTRHKSNGEVTNVVGGMYKDEAEEEAKRLQDETWAEYVAELMNNKDVRTVVETAIGQKEPVAPEMPSAVDGSSAKLSDLLSSLEQYYSKNNIEVNGTIIDPFNLTKDMVRYFDDSSFKAYLSHLEGQVGNDAQTGDNALYGIVADALIASGEVDPAYIYDNGEYNRDGIIATLKEKDEKGKLSSATDQIYQNLPKVSTADKTAHPTQDVLKVNTSANTKLFQDIVDGAQNHYAENGYRPIWADEQYAIAEKEYYAKVLNYPDELNAWIEERDDLIKWNFDFFQNEVAKATEGRYIVPVFNGIYEVDAPEITSSVPYQNNMEDFFSSAYGVVATNPQASSATKAEALFHNIMVKGLYSMPELIQFLNTEDSDLVALGEFAPDLATIVDNVIQKDENGERLINADGSYSLVTDPAQLEHAYAQFMTLLASLTDNYSNVFSANRVTSAAYAQFELQNYQAGNAATTKTVEFLSEIIGERLSGKIQAGSSKMYDGIDQISRDAYKEDIFGEDYFLKNEDGSLVTDNASVQEWYESLSDDQRAQRQYVEDYLAYATAQNQRIAQETLTPDEDAYVNSLISNAYLGISGLTLSQQHAGVNTMLDVVAAGKTGKVDGVSYGGITNYLATRDSGMIDAYTNGINSLPAYLAAAQVIEDASIVNEDGSEFTINDLSTIDVGSEQYEQADAAQQAAGLSAEQALAVIEAQNTEMMVHGVKAASKYGNATEEVANNMAALKGDARSVANAYKNQNSTLTQTANNQFYRKKYASGARDSDTVSAIVAMTGLDEDSVKEHSDYVNSILDEMYDSDMESVQNQVSAWDQFLMDDEIVLQLPSVVGSSGSIDQSEAVASMTGDAASELKALADALSSLGFSASIVASGDGENMTYKIVVTDFADAGGRKSGGGGGGGGGGKSAVQKLLDEQKKEQTLWEHRRKMIQYEATRYKNAGELSNYAIMLKHESAEIQRQIGLREKQLDALKKQMAITKKYSDDWYELRDAILSTEEALSELQNDYEDLDRTIAEIKIQILQFEQELQESVSGVIEEQLQKERDKLSGTVSMQDTIVEAIRRRYEEEWELMQKDIDKKRRALEEEMSMIDERLQRRKDAEDEAAKYEELAELQRQLAFIGADSSRTKDQAELREKIADIQKELAWKAAEDEAAAQKEGLQEQLDAYDDYETEYQEYLDEYLEDANNFKTEVDGLLKGSQEELFAWLQSNVEEYGNSLSEMQQQMLQGWQDTYDQMKDIIHTFWDEASDITISKESYIEFMKANSEEYRTASEPGKAQLEQQWGENYDKWIAAKKKSEEVENYEHEDSEDDPGTRQNNQYVTRTYYGGYDSSGNWVTGYGSSFADANAIARQKGLSGVKTSTSGYPPDPNASTNNNDSYTPGLWWVTTPSGTKLSTGFDTSSAATGYKYQQVDKYFQQLKAATSGGAPQDIISSITAKLNQWKTAGVNQYSQGGYVDYTGLAMVHGSASKPEAFLSADDTMQMRAMLDSWQFMLKRPVISNVDSALTDRSSRNTFGDINVSITEATFSDDSDYEEVARRVGEAFTKELSKQGFRTSVLNF